MAFWHKSIGFVFSPNLCPGTGFRDALFFGLIHQGPGIRDCAQAQREKQEPLQDFHLLFDDDVDDNDETNYDDDVDDSAKYNADDSNVRIIP